MRNVSTQWVYRLVAEIQHVNPICGLMDCQSIKIIDGSNGRCHIHGNPYIKGCKKFTGESCWSKINPEWPKNRTVDHRCDIKCAIDTYHWKNHSFTSIFVND